MIDSDGACTSTTLVIAGLDERAQSAWQTAPDIGSCTAKLRLPWSRRRTGRMKFPGNSRWRLSLYLDRLFAPIVLLRHIDRRVVEQNSWHGRCRYEVFPRPVLAAVSAQKVDSTTCAVLAVHHARGLGAEVCLTPFSKLDASTSSPHCRVQPRRGSRPPKTKHLAQPLEHQKSRS